MLWSLVVQPIQVESRDVNIDRPYKERSIFWGESAAFKDFYKTWLLKRDLTEIADDQKSNIANSRKPSWQIVLWYNAKFIPFVYFALCPLTCNWSRYTYILHLMLYGLRKVNSEQMGNGWLCMRWQFIVVNFSWIVRHLISVALNVMSCTSTQYTV